MHEARSRSGGRIFPQPRRTVVLEGADFCPENVGQPRSRLASWSALILLLTFAPFAFGAVEYWAVAVVEVLAVAVFLCWAAGEVLRCQITVELSLPVLAAASFQFWIACQVVFSKTMDAEATCADLLLLFCYFALYLAVCNESWPRQWVFNLAVSITVIGSALALLGLIQFFDWNGKLYWLRPLQDGTPFGPYVDRNHFAGLMEMTIPTALGLIFSGRFSRAWNALVIFLTGLMVAAILLTFSRAGVMSLCIGLATFGAVLRRRAGNARMIFLLAIIGLLGLSVVGWVGIGSLLSRLFGASGLGHEATYADRLRIYHDTLRSVPRHPLMGTGLGTFSLLSPGYVSWYSEYRWDRVHNDYLQVLAETGLVGFTLVVAWIFGFIRSFFRTFQNTSQSLQAIRLAAFCGCLALLFHSFADFNLQIPANAVYFAVLSAIASRPLTNESSKHLPPVTAG